MCIYETMPDCIFRQGRNLKIPLSLQLPLARGSRMVYHDHKCALFLPTTHHRLLTKWRHASIWETIVKTLYCQQTHMVKTQMQ